MTKLVQKQKELNLKATICPFCGKTVFTELKSEIAALEQEQITYKDIEAWAKDNVYGNSLSPDFNNSIMALRYRSLVSGAKAVLSNEIPHIKGG